MKTLAAFFHALAVAVCASQMQPGFATLLTILIALVLTALGLVLTGLGGEGSMSHEDR